MHQQWKGELMICDIDYRYRRALEPDGLTTYATAIRALNEAIEDARLAGRSAADCPAVLLLTRHLSRIAEGVRTRQDTEDADLRRQCIDKLADLKRSPAIVALVRRGIDYRQEELRHYRREGSRTLRMIAFELGMAHNDYRLGYTTPQESLAGDHTLEARGLYIRISPERFGERCSLAKPALETARSHDAQAPITVLQDIRPSRNGSPRTDSRRRRPLI